MRRTFIAASAAFFICAANPSAFAQNAPQNVPETLTVTLSSYAFAPDTIRLKTGVPVRLHLVNSADKGHSFAAPEFFAAASVASTQPKVENGEVEVDPGQSVDLLVIPARAGIYPLDCSHFLHAIMGMRGHIAVE